MKALIYDCEIVKAIPSNREPVIPGIEYCAGWHDHANMGISVIGAYEFHADRYRVFCQDNFAEFVSLVIEQEVVIGFNNKSFDDRLVDAVIGGNIDELLRTRSYDLLSEVWLGAGLGPRYNGPQYSGYGLDDLAKAEHLQGKTGHGALAPIQWQQGKIGAVIDYCLQDVKITKELIERVLIEGCLNNPKRDGSIPVRKPWEMLP